MYTFAWIFCLLPSWNLLSTWRTFDTWCFAGVKFFCSKCGQEGHRSFYCPTVREISGRAHFRCRLCGGKGHNSRTCGKPKSENECQRQPRHCSQCGERGHNRRNCPRSTTVEVEVGASGYIVKQDNVHSSGIYSCSFCSAKGHNRRTCPKRKSSIGQQKDWNIGVHVNPHSNLMVFAEKFVMVAFISLYNTRWCTGPSWFLFALYIFTTTFALYTCISACLYIVSSGRVVYKAKGFRLSVHSWGMTHGGLLRTLLWRFTIVCIFHSKDLIN